MRNRQRGLRPIYYALYLDQDEVQYDDDGYELSEPVPQYGEPVLIRVNYGPEKKWNQMEAFGTMEEYDLVFSVCDANCPINRNSRIWINTDPEQDEPYDYVVRRVGTTKNVRLYGLKAVTVA